MSSGKLCRRLYGWHWLYQSIQLFVATCIKEDELLSSYFISTFSFEILISEAETVSVCCPVNTESLQFHLSSQDAAVEEMGIIKFPTELSGGRRKQLLWKTNKKQVLIHQNGTPIYEKCKGRTLIPLHRKGNLQNQTISAQIQQKQRNKSAYPLMWFLWISLSPTVAYRQKPTSKNRNLLESAAHLDRIRETLPEHLVSDMSEKNWTNLQQSWNVPNTVALKTMGQEGIHCPLQQKTTISGNSISDVNDCNTIFG